jgi:5'-3' exonuclease
MDNEVALLIDARNALYRAIFAVKSDKRHKIKYHYFVAFLRQIVSWIREYHPNTVHVFWDAPRSTVWRKQICKEYKQRDKSKYVEDISKELSQTTKIAQSFLNLLNVRQYNRNGMEADDLIYAYVTLSHPNKTIVVSTDSDMVQLPYYFSSCDLYNPVKKQIVPVPSVNPVFQKALVGDSSDNIKGYHGIGPKKSEKLLADNKLFVEFLKANSKNVLYRNLMLIDLSLNPRLLANKMYVYKKMSSSVNFDTSQVKSLAQEFKVQGFLTEYADLVPPFSKLI